MGRTVIRDMKSIQARILGYRLGQLWISERIEWRLAERSLHHYLQSYLAHYLAEQNH